MSMEGLWFHFPMKPNHAHTTWLSYEYHDAGVVMVTSYEHHDAGVAMAMSVQTHQQL